ncbi:MAG: hypothetical protein P1Q69_15515 [Candidatus Thorarchaeota archaeon]|nr:hypothetical protein [Candidatus Thorarchaeota archaeon]
MTDYDRLHEIAREDVHTCIEVWNEILSAEDRKVEYAYAKGSATKKWDSPIDYVPEISDVDINVQISHDEGLFHPPNDFNDAMQLSEKYEKRFHEIRPDALHMPRSQIMVLNRLKEVVEYSPLRISDVHILFGDPEQEEFPNVNTIRKMDIANLLKMEEKIEPIPRQVFDRAGHDFWSVIRIMTWRVSPSPVRLLSQTHDDPIDLWSWNRTRVEKELREQYYDQIADSYRGFYMSGWDLFLSEFKSLNAYRSVVIHGYNLIKQCMDEGKKFIRR